MEDFIEAHKFSNNHMEQLKKDKVCGCFNCLRIYAPSNIFLLISLLLPLHNT